MKRLIIVGAIDYRERRRVKLKFVSGLNQIGSLRFVKALRGIEDYIKFGKLHLSCQEDYEDHDESAAIQIPSIATNVRPSVHHDEEPAPEFRSHRGRTIRLPVCYRRSLDD